MDSFEILQKGVNAWNAWRKDNPGIQPVFEGKIIKNLNLEKAELYRSKFINCQIVASNFYGAIINRAEIINTRIDNSIFCNSDFFGAKISDSEINHSDFSKIEIEESVESDEPDE